MTAPVGIILVGHEVLDSISQAEMLAALPEEYVSLPRQHVSLGTVKTSLGELGSFDWITGRSNQEAEVLEKLKPVIDANPGWRVQYFGAAPIPLAMALGYQLSGWADVDVYQKSHDASGTWKWPKQELTPELLRPLRLPQERVKAPGDVVLRISLSHMVHSDDTSTVIAEAIGEIDVALHAPHEDGLRSFQDLGEVASSFGDALDWVRACRPNAQIHVFASLTVGAAFRFGTSINPTIHGPVHAYQYFGTQTPRYQRAFVLQQPARAEPGLTAEDRAECAGLRLHAAEELAEMKKAIATLRDRGGLTWIDNAFPGHDAGFGESFRALDKVYETPLAESEVDLVITDVAEGFAYNAETRTWEISDGLLHAIGRRLASDDERRLALRLFLLHEAIHQGKHRLRGGLQIRRFPKVVEELDYQADTWAFLHEVVMSRLSADGSDLSAIRLGLLQVIKAAISTFWAFDSAADPSRMKIRRVNRYLIWYWQRLQIEALDDGDVEGHLRVMANKPIVEVAGAQVRMVGDRVFFFLDEVSNAEIALLSRSQLFRFGHGNGSQVADVFKGIRERSDETIARALRTIADQVS